MKEKLKNWQTRIVSPLAEMEFEDLSWWVDGSRMVVSNMNFIFHYIYGIILPIDELVFFKMLIAPPPTGNLW